MSGLISCIYSLSVWGGRTKRIKKKPPVSASRRIRSITREGRRPATNYKAAFIQLRLGRDDYFTFFSVSQLKKEVWAPDFGPATFVPSWGATVTGARKFLIAYNVNLISTKEQAHRIALDVREQGRGKDQVHAEGRFSAAFSCLPPQRPGLTGFGVLKQPGLLRKVQGMGWYLDEANIAQVSTNILDYDVTPLHVVYEEICKDAKVCRRQSMQLHQR